MKSYNYAYIFRNKPYMYQRVFHALEAGIAENYTDRSQDEIFLLLARYLKVSKRNKAFVFSLCNKRVEISTRVKNITPYIQPLLYFKWPAATNKVQIKRKKSTKRAA